MARTSRTSQRARERFLSALAEGLSVTGACHAASLPRRTAYDWRDADAEFGAAWDAAIEQGTDILEDEARRRAYVGTDTPVTYQGEITATYKEYSDRLLELLLKARRPHVYRERQSVEHSGAVGVNVAVTHMGVLTDAQLDALAALGRAGEQR